MEFLFSIEVNLMTQNKSSSTPSHGSSLGVLVMYGIPKGGVETFGSGCVTYSNTMMVVSRETTSFLSLLTTWSNVTRTTEEAISS